MPRRVSLKDSIKIYYAYRLGTDSSDREVFSSVKECYAQLSSREGDSKYSRYGSEDTYTLSIIINIDNNTQYFDKYTRIWVFNEPICASDDNDYVIVSDPVVKNGQFIIDCDSVAVNYTDFWYLYDSRILKFQAIDKMEDNCFFVKKNVYLPIDTNTQMWYIEPDDKTSKDGSMRLTNKVYQNKFVKYEIEKLDDNE